ncbi:MAG: hypothetical protein SFT81_07400 [Candidatus Caenarcaniphilales bacterium]|nr:hypothetical protein [Candidatus Caenarcaniphilales bacterium]
MSGLISHLAAGGSFAQTAYNRVKMEDYYKSAEFRKKIPEFCHFKSDIFAVSRIKAPSRSVAYEALRLSSDFPNKYQHDKYIDPAGSYQIHPREADLGMIYHFAYRKNPWSGPVATDYLQEISTSSCFRGCIVWTNAMFRYSSIEYRIVQEGEQYFLEREAKLVLSFPFPAALARQKLLSVNQDSLRDIISHAEKKLANRI